MGVASQSTRRRRTEKLSLAPRLGLGALLLISATPPPEHEQYEVVLEGRPQKRVIVGQTEAGWTVYEEELDSDDSEEYLVRVVTDRRGNYFWASREMRPMAREESEGFVTYSAGRFGYVKTAQENTLDVSREMARGADLGEDFSEYMEHVVDVLYSINYWGTRTDYPAQGPHGEDVAVTFADSSALGDRLIHFYPYTVDIEAEALRVLAAFERGTDADRAGSDDSVYCRYQSREAVPAMGGWRSLHWLRCDEEWPEPRTFERLGVTDGNSRERRGGVRVAIAKDGQTYEMRCEDVSEAGEGRWFACWLP